MSATKNIHELKSKLDSTFERARQINHEEFELRSDLARHLCILVSGYLETAIIEWLLYHTENGARPSVQKYVESNIKWFTNAKANKILDLLAQWDKSWHKEMEEFLVDEKKDAVDSIIALRNNIAHGRWVGTSLTSISDYYEEIEKVVNKMGEIVEN